MSANRRMIAPHTPFLALSLALLVAGPVAAREHLVAAQGAPGAPGAQSPDGSTGAPWPSVAAALASGQVGGGDTLVLRDGAHGPLVVSTRQPFDPPLVIRAASGGQAHVDRIAVPHAGGLVVHGLQVWPRDPQGRVRRLVETGKSAAHVRFEALDVRGSPDAPDTYMDWTREDWTVTWPTHGVRLDGSDNSIVGSRITGTNFAITTTGPRAQVRNNHIAGFAGDGMRGLGDGSVFVGNHVQDCVKVNDNHDDGFQSWSIRTGPDGRKTVRDITLEGNTIMEWTGARDHPLRCRLQGIGLFDGIYRNFTIRNNLVAVSAYHGIALYGGIDSEIVNNTVVHIDSLREDYPWIMLSDHKNGAEALGNTVANNVAPAYRSKTAAAPPIDKKHNAVIRNPFGVYRDPAALDFRPADGSVLIDAGDASVAPPHDIRGTARPQGSVPDLGAFESD